MTAEIAIPKSAADLARDRVVGVRDDIRAALRVVSDWVFGEDRITVTVRELKALHAARGRHATLVLPAKWSLRQELTLPSQAGKHLTAIVENKIREMTPFDLDDVHYACRVASRERGEITVEIAVAPRKFVEPCIAAARKTGLIIDRIEAEGAPGLNIFAQSDVNPLTRKTRAGALARLNMALLALCAVLIFGGGAARLGLAHAQRASAEASAAEVTQARRQVQRLVRSSRSLDVVIRRSPEAARLLNALAAALGDDAWLDRVVIRRDALEIQGYADNATSALVAVERLEGVEGATFRSAVSRDEASKKERFAIRAQLEMEQ